MKVVVTDEKGRSLRRPGLARWLVSVAPARARGQVTLALVGDRVMRRLNREFAGHDYATDVLSFPSREAGSKPDSTGLPDSTGPFLGDVVIATGVATRQARQAHHSLDVELRVLALHGLLHLLGFDHTADNGQMARLERRLRSKGGLEDGLIERGQR